MTYLHMVDLLGGSINLPCPMTLPTSKGSRAATNSIPILVEWLCDHLVILWLPFILLVCPILARYHLTSIQGNQPASPAIMAVIWNRAIFESHFLASTINWIPADIVGHLSITCKLSCFTNSLTHCTDWAPYGAPLITHSAVGCGAASLSASGASLTRLSPRLPGACFSFSSGLLITCPSLTFAPVNLDTFPPWFWHIILHLSQGRGQEGGVLDCVLLRV